MKTMQKWVRQRKARHANKTLRRPGKVLAAQFKNSCDFYLRVTTEKIEPTFPIALAICVPIGRELEHIKTTEQDGAK